MGMHTAVATVSLYLVSGAAASRWKNVTVYHVHPSSNLHGDLRDMNSGDQAGDVSSSLQTAARCLASTCSLMLRARVCRCSSPHAIAGCRWPVATVPGSRCLQNVT